MAVVGRAQSSEGKIDKGSRDGEETAGRCQPELREAVLLKAASRWISDLLASTGFIVCDHLFAQLAQRLSQPVIFNALHLTVNARFFVRRQRPGRDG